MIDMAGLLSREVQNSTESKWIEQVIFQGGVSGVVCFALCVTIFFFELVCVCQGNCKYKLPHSRKKSFVLRYFVYLTSACTVYTGIRSLYFIHFFIYNDSSDIAFCEALGFFNCNVKLIMLFFMLVLIMLILFNVFRCFQRPGSSKKCLSLKKHYTCYEFIFVICIFLSPLFVCWIPFTTNHYGSDGPYCWIKTSFFNDTHYQKTGSLEETFLWLVPLYTTVGVACFCVFLITARLCYLQMCKTKLLKDKRTIIAKETCLLLALFITNACVFLLVLIVYNVLDLKIDLVLYPIAGAFISLISCIYLVVTIAVHRRRGDYLQISNAPEQNKTLQYKTVPPSTRVSLPSRTSQHAPCFLSPSEA